MTEKQPHLKLNTLLGAMVDDTNMRIYFWDGIFSQWNMGDIVDPNLGVTLNCAEQGMMLNKAKMFGDEEAYEKILKAKAPWEQKELGRGVKHFDVNIWRSACRGLVAEINYNKFSQPEAKNLLLLSTGYEIVEASPYDKIWGIGLGVEHPDVTDKSKWRGTNWLGIAIEEARTLILEE